MTRPARTEFVGEPSFGRRVQFGIWSDGPVPAEELQLRLRDHGQQVVIAQGDRDTPVDCFVALTRTPPNLAQRAILTKLANRAAITIAVEQPLLDPDVPEAWPRDISLRWSGQINELTTLAADLMTLVRPAGPIFSRLPTLLPADETVPGADVATSRDMLVEKLNGRLRPRAVPVAAALWNDLYANRKAVSRTDYSLRRLAAWTAHPGSRSLVNLRLARPEDLTVSLTKPLSLDEVISDPLTRPLVMLLGEPSAGKSLQLRYYDAHAALRCLEMWPDTEAVPATFYVALADQPAKPNISLAWLRQRWALAVDVARWCDFDQFLGDGGTVLLDGLNEGGVRGLEPEQWMTQWRDVIQEMFDHGVGKVVVTCRTRDQVVQMNVPRDRPPTKVTILSLSRGEILAIATARNVDMARRLAQAFDDDPRLVELYANPVRLHSYLESGVRWVATTSTRLFGGELATAIIREWGHDLPHGRLIPGAQASNLEAMSRANQDPWPELETIPLVRALGQLAKQLSLPAMPNGPARLVMPPGETGEFLARTIRQVDDHPVKPQEALETAKDLDVLRLDQGRIRFAHPSVQHLFAAVGCSIDELAQLAEPEHQPVADNGGPPDAGPPSYAQHRYDEIFQFAAQLRGVDVPARLLAVDAVLAARVFAAIRHEAADSVVRDRIVADLRTQLDTSFVPRIRATVLAALGDLGWSLPSAGAGGRGATMMVPAGRWRLGRVNNAAVPEGNVSSESRDIDLPSFRISRFPVSNAEFAGFVEDGGYQDPSLWPPEGWEWRTRQRAQEEFVAGWRRRQIRLQQDFPANTIRLLRSKVATPAGAAALVRFATMTESEMFAYARALQEQPLTAPRFWQKKPLRNRLQPVVGVSWFEANAFCVWLSRRLGTAVRLPSENEWEAACLHSWGVTSTVEIAERLGHVFGNTSDLRWPATTPIGAFAAPTQARRNLAVDMLGNAFEWVFDHYAPGEHNRRIVKGGSWRHKPWRAHPAYRGRGDVDAQNEDLGFRFVIAEEPA
ncbi:SUMF1/EgtB/PvdO family nonheme iron enzyme [Actinoplanes palleronii]|uniref:Sulfatase-modifying factor enzyme-like domain-containing protein n=1 Tax=Actinoplanes palleronii TaxID=113570 RepID=A0ABQ4BSW9_9ACTN|nr:SUMF1/EgtB/PvdO family nonheme iron enzyme [Actinoplanes palleronii]GIE73361.1 hypothetical protein Apa02nite_094690 [Actinoplanes palleronii]